MEKDFGEIHVSKQKNKKVAYFVFAPSKISPSSMVRGFIYKDIISTNFHVKYFKFYSKYRGLKQTSLLKKIILKAYDLIISFLNSIKALYEIKNFQFLIIIKYINPLYLKIIKFFFNGKILFDFDDAIWLDSFGGEKRFINIITNSDYVSCDNSFLLKKAQLYNKNSFILNGPVNSNKPLKKLLNKTLTIGWIGSPSTIFYLLNISNKLKKSHHLKNLNLKIIGASEKDHKLIRNTFNNFKKVKIIGKYDSTQMIEELKEVDIGLYPIDSSDLSKGRGSLKALIYMGNSIPCIMSNEGNNSHEFTNQHNSILTENKNWSESLNLLIKNKSLYNKIKNNGYEYVYNNYSLENCFKQLKINFLDKHE